MAQTLGGRYDLEVILGRGGFGEVWRGRDRATRRPVAVKLIQLAPGDAPDLLAETINRFQREAAVLGGLKHPNIVAGIDAGQNKDTSQLFLVMELAQGISLASFLTQRAARGAGLFPVADVLGIAGQVCAGLAAAHAAGLVHRDIKPSNLMVSEPLRIKIVDFGIVRLLDDSSPRLTLPRTALGTVAYMSPEQAMGGDLDGRADLYSLGCVLYELLTGRPPFLDEEPEAVLMMQIEKKEVPLRTVRPGLPAGLGELVGDLLHKDPAARPADAAEVTGRIAGLAGTLSAAPRRHQIDIPTKQAGDDEAGGPGDADGPEWTPLPETMRYGQEPGVAGQGARTPARPPATSRLRLSRRRRLRHRRLRSAFSTILTLAIVAGVAAYVWKERHDALPMERVVVGVVGTPGITSPHHALR
jgi:serine/threonine-protein kinase